MFLDLLKLLMAACNYIVPFYHIVPFRIPYSRSHKYLPVVYVPWLRLETTQWAGARENILEQ